MRTPTRPLTAVVAAPTLLAAGCGGGDDKSSSTPTATQPQRAPASAATISDLRGVQTSTGHPVFWAGRKRGYTYELSRTADGNIYVRYLPPGVPVGAAGSDFLSVGTYPQKDAFKAIQAAKKQEGEIVKPLPGGGFAVASPNRPQSVYFAYPDSQVLVEVYDPSPARAMRLVTSGDVAPVR